MKRSLRKTTASISISYSDKNFSNNLTGKEFEVESSENTINLSINLASNLSVKNKSSNCYADACELAKNHSLLQSVHIYEKQIIDGLIAAYQRAPSAYWKLELRLGSLGSFKYSIKPKELNGSVFLNVY